MTDADDAETAKNKSGAYLYYFYKTSFLEPGVKAYLLRILNTLSVGLLWMAVNSTAGIMYGLGFVEDHIRTANILFYLFFGLSSFFYLRWVIRLWKEPIDFEQ